MRFRLPLTLEGRPFYLALGGDRLLCKFVKLSDNRCPKKVVCFWDAETSRFGPLNRPYWEGDVKVTLRVNDQTITLNDHDTKWCNAALVDYEGTRYKFQGQQLTDGSFVFTVKS